MTSKLFKLGDRVHVVRFGGMAFSSQSVSSEHELTKRHKGNGNFIIDKEQYTERGVKVTGRSTWGPRYRFVRSGSEDLKKILEGNRSVKLKHDISDSLDSLRKFTAGMDVDGLDNLDDALSTLVDEYQPN
jgi:hypothetical protein